MIIFLIYIIISLSIFTSWVYSTVSLMRYYTLKAKYKSFEDILLTTEDSKMALEFIDLESMYYVFVTVEFIFIVWTIITISLLT